MLLAFFESHRRLGQQKAVKRPDTFPINTSHDCGRHSCRLTPDVDLFRVDHQQPHEEFRLPLDHDDLVAR